MHQTRSPGFLVAGIAGLLLAFSAAAQEFPNRPLRIVVPYPPGGGPDIVGRGLAVGMSRSLGQSVVMDNKAGGGGVPAVMELKNSQPDGHTLFLPDSSQWAVFPAVRDDLPYDPLKDFAAIGLVYSNNLFIFVGGTSPFRTLSDLVARAKEKPGSLRYGMSGIGGIMHIVGEAFRLSTNVTTIAVPFRNSAAAATAVMSGDLDYAVAGLQSIRSLAQAGRLRILATSSSKRDRVVPEIPTVAETIGIKDFNFVAEVGLVARAGTPRPVIARLAKSLADGQKEPAYLDALKKLEYDVASNTPEEFAVQIRGDLEHFRRVVKSANIKAE
jgi:tripartite-type tricarboxylate transporter receptor subunit TctC